MCPFAALVNNKNKPTLASDSVNNETKDQDTRSQKTSSTFSMIFGVSVYMYFLWVFVYAIFFVGNLTAAFGTILPHAAFQLFPKSIDFPSTTSNKSMLMLLFENSWFLGAFAIQHATMARAPFKKFMTTYFYSTAVERSVFVLATCILLHCLFATWTPMTQVVFEFHDAAKPIVWGAYFAGWLLVLASTFMIDHFDLFGISPAFGIKSTLGSESFKTPFLYGWIRHPIMTGFLLAFWAAPIMTTGRMLFAVLTTGFIFLDVFFLEERDLKRAHPEYHQYTQKVGAFWPTSVSPFVQQQPGKKVD